VQALSALPPENVLHIWYEDLLDAPGPTLSRIAGFLGPEFVDEEWERRSAARMARPSSSWRALPAAERDALDEACRAGFSSLAAHNVTRCTNTPDGAAYA
jgi:putative sulfotransferase